MQRLIIAGNCGKDAELRSLGNGDPVLNFSLAIDNGKDKNGERRETTWYDCSMFGKRAEALAPHIKKGDRLTLIGRPTVRVHEGKAYLGISVDDLTFMGSANKPAQSGGSSDDYREKRTIVVEARPYDDEDSIPF
jgi:single-strand DNA-binding protein